MVCEAIVNRVPVAPVRLNPDLPAELERIIDRALDKDRELRYQSANDMRAELQRLTRGTMCLTRTWGSFPVALGTGRRHWRSIARGAAAGAERRVSYSNLGYTYAPLNRLDDAEAVYKHATERNLESEILLAYRYQLAFLKGDVAQMGTGCQPPLASRV